MYTVSLNYNYTIQAAIIPREHYSVQLQAFKRKYLHVPTRHHVLERSISNYRTIIIRKKEVSPVEILPFSEFKTFVERRTYVWRYFLLSNDKRNYSGDTPFNAIFSSFKSFLKTQLTIIFSSRERAQRALSGDTNISIFENLDLRPSFRLRHAATTALVSRPRCNHSTCEPTTLQPQHL